MESNVLRFVAKMDTTKPIEVDRRFTISYFLSDDTILVFEPPQRNSGILGGKFLERGRVKKPDGSSYYNAQVRNCVLFSLCVSQRNLRKSKVNFTLGPNFFTLLFF